MLSMELIVVILAHHNSLAFSNETDYSSIEEDGS